MQTHVPPQKTAILAIVAEIDAYHSILRYEESFIGVLGGSKCHLTGMVMLADALVTTPRSDHEMTGGEPEMGGNTDAGGRYTPFCKDQMSKLR